MRFERPSSPDPLRNKKSPWGLLRMGLLLGFVLIGWQWASWGRNGEWLGRSNTGAETLPSLSHIEFEVQPVSGELTPAPENSAPLPEAPADSANRLPSAWLAPMQDGRLGLTPSEQTGLDQALQRVRFQTVDELQAAAILDVGFVSLNQHPEQYRGRLLRFEGKLWKLSLLHAGDSTRTGDEVYEAWLYTPDASNHPTRVLFIDLPATLTLGERLDQPVEWAGYFIKRYGYQTSRGTHVAPLFVAKTLVVSPHAQVATKYPSGKTWSQRLGELLVVGAGSSLLIWYLSGSRKGPGSENQSP